MFLVFFSSVSAVSSDVCCKLFIHMLQGESIVAHVTTRSSLFFPLQVKRCSRSSLTGELVV
jgi:hypothetical protein